MRYGRILVLAGLAGALPACLPQTAGNPGGQGAGGGQSQPHNASQVATAGEIDRYVRAGSAFIEHYFRGEQTHIECAYFDDNQNYESIVFELDYGDYSWDWKSNFSGAWDIVGDRLCFSGTYYGATDDWFGPPEPDNGCYVAEWSTNDDALLLISAADEVLATIITSDGPANFQRFCDL